MAKIYGLFGSMTGKVADVVMAVRHGEQIARKYQPIVSNPKSAAQAETRAKLKLMSQLSAVCGPVIAIRRIGSKSPRNLFVKSNFPLAGYSENMATINLNRVQLTSSVVGMTPFAADRTSGTKIAVSLDNDSAATFDRVVYVAFEKQNDNSLRLLGSAVAMSAGNNGTFPAELPHTSNAVVVMAYGVRDNNDTARTIFGNLNAPIAEEVAKLVVTRRLTEYDVTLSETLGLTMAVGENTGDSENFERATVSLSSYGSGSVSGAGRYPIGTQVTVRATAGPNAQFDGWYLNSVSGTRVSTNAAYSFTVEDDITLVAKFVGAPVTVTVQSEDTNKGTVSGGQTVSAGSSVTVVALPKSGYAFSAWKNGNTVVSTNASYTFTLTGNITLTAYFEESQSVVLAVSGNATGVTIGGVDYTAGQEIPVQVGQVLQFSVNPSGLDIYYGYAKNGNTVLEQANMYNGRQGNITWPQGATTFEVVASHE